MTIVRNESARLPRLLDSLADFRRRGGEVVVLDTGSSDETPKAAAAAGCRVYVEPARFRGRVTEAQAGRVQRTFARGGDGPLLRSGEALFHFGNARAHAASLAANDFQIAMDGGDVAENLDVDFLDSVAGSACAAGVFETRTLSPIGWHVEMRDYAGDRRLMRWNGRSHNHLARRRGVQPSPPLRFTREQLFVTHHTDLGKPRAYQFAGMALDALEEPESVRAVYYFARALTAQGFHRSGQELAQSLDRSTVPPAVRSAALCFVARCAAGLGGGKDEIETLLFRAARRDPARRDPLLRLATRFLAHGELLAAASFASAALAIPARVGFSEPEQNLGAGPHAILYWALLWLGRRDEAAAHFERCRVLEPSNPVYAAHAALFEST